MKTLFLLLAVLTGTTHAQNYWDSTRSAKVAAQAYLKVGSTVHGSTSFFTDSTSIESGDGASTATKTRSESRNGGDDVTKAQAIAKAQVNESSRWINATYQHDLQLIAKSSGWKAVSATKAGADATMEIVADESGLHQAYISLASGGPDYTCSLINENDLTLEAADGKGSWVKAVWNENTKKWDLTGAYLNSAEQLITISESTSGSILSWGKYVYARVTLDEQFTMSVDANGGSYDPPIDQHYQHDTASWRLMGVGGGASIQSNTILDL